MSASPAGGPAVLAVNKPKGPTSFEMVRRLKRALGPARPRKVGHFGSLDPFARGVVLLGWGGAMKFNEAVQERCPKTYVATGLFGTGSPTGDTDCPGDALSRVPADRALALGADELESLFRRRFLGVRPQRPHPWSASKHRGRPLHQWAREGVRVEKPPVPRTVHSIDVLRWDPPRLAFRTTVGSGTFIRVLFEDLALELGTRGVLEELTRTAVGPCRIEDALDGDRIQEAQVLARALPPEALLAQAGR